MRQSARFGVAACSAPGSRASATERTFFTKMASTIFGSEGRPACGDGGPGPPNFYPMPKSVNGVQDMIEDDSGALLIATGEGVRQLKDGKAGADRIPDIGPRF